MSRKRTFHHFKSLTYCHYTMVYTHLIIASSLMCLCGDQCNVCSVDLVCMSSPIDCVYFVRLALSHTAFTLYFSVVSIHYGHYCSSSPPTPLSTVIQYPGRPANHFTRVVINDLIGCFEFFKSQMNSMFDTCRWTRQKGCPYNYHTWIRTYRLSAIQPC